MSIFNELLPKISEISHAYTKNFNDDLKAAFACFDKFEEEFLNAKNKTRDKTQKDKSALTVLQSINEDDDESVKKSEESNRSSSKSNDRTSTESTERNAKKRSKNEVDGMESPEQDKRQKRNASVKAQSIISKQVNVNLTQKLRRENSLEKSGRSRRRGKEDKENAEPVPIVQVKQEKISMPPEPMDLECLPLNVEVKKEVDKDEIAMPPPVAPVPKPRKAIPKEKPEEMSEEETSGRRRTTRTRKQTDTLPAPPSSRSTRASSRSTKQTDTEEPQPEARPKRTRAKKAQEPPATDTEKDSQNSAESEPASPAEKPRTKRTRRVQKQAEKEPEPEKVEPKPQQEIISPKEERISQPEVNSPILPVKKNDSKPKLPETTQKTNIPVPEKNNTKSKLPETQENDKEINENNDNYNDLDKTKMIALNSTVTISNDMDKTVVLPNGVYNHAPVTPKNVRQMNETVVLETCNQTVVLDKPANAIMDATVVIDKDPKAKVAENNSLLTDDDDSIEVKTPPKNPPLPQPTSAVKEKVQQFEEMATRVTRTKTRAMAKKEDTNEQTPPDKVSKPILSSETLAKMNMMIFNGKAPQISSSATKPRANVTTKSYIPSSTSKLSAINKAREEENQKKEKEDARSKKEALLEAKRELQKKRREEKMAAAAAARLAAERERKALLEAAARERQEKQAHADQGKLERLKEAERKKLELARKVAETEERRKAEEQARQQRLAEEQKRAEAAWRKQQEEAEATKKEAALMAKEIERRQKEFMERERQKMKQRIEDKMLTPLKNGPALEPVYMADGFQYLNSDEEAEPPERPIPTWSTSKARRLQLLIQARIPSRHIDRLFSVREHSPDLREIFPDIERARLKRTSSAVWRTPPRALPPVRE